MDIKNIGGDFTKWLQILATAFVGGVGVYFTDSNSKEQERNRISQLTTQLMSNREQSETEFRRNIFQPLIDKILSDSIPLEKRLTVFTIFLNNFNELFNSRAIFDELDAAAELLIKNKDEKTRARGIKIHQDLISLARRTADMQLQIIEDIHSSSVSYTRQVGEDINATFSDFKAPMQPTSRMKSNRTEGINLNIREISDEYIKVTATLANSAAEWKFINHNQPFEVSYFDLPFTDNMLLPDKTRAAIILDMITTEGDGTKKAVVKIIHFPGDVITTGYRPSINAAKEMMEKAHGGEITTGDKQ